MRTLVNATLAAVLTLGLVTSSSQALVQVTPAPEVNTSWQGPQLSPADSVEGSVVMEGVPAGRPTVIESAPIPSQVCYPIKVLREKATHSAKKMYRCYGAPIEQTICVDNPADCKNCLYAVPVCVPACCTGVPECCNERKGLLGRGYVTYRWPCGFEVDVTFLVHGGVFLRYR